MERRVKSKVKGKTKQPVISKRFNRESDVTPNSKLQSSNPALRIVDANMNRCREGLRVVEDSLRFILNDDVLYKKVRKVRHETDKVLRDKYGILISKRDSYNDSGRKMPEKSIKSLPAVIVANFKRAQESLRVLEEYSKTVFPAKAALFKKQRYALYNLEKKVFLDVIFQTGK